MVVRIEHGDQARPGQANDPEGTVILRRNAPVRWNRAVETGVVAYVWVVIQREIIHGRPNRLARHLVGHRALDPDAALQLEIDGHRVQAGRVRHEGVDADIRLVVARQKPDLVASALGQPGQPIAAIGVGRGLDDVPTGDRVIGQLVTLDGHARQRFPCVHVADHADDRLGRRGRVLEVGAVVGGHDCAVP